MRKQQQHSQDLPARKWAMLTAIGIGLLFPLTGTLVIAMRSGSLLRFQEMLRIHVLHPEIFLGYLIPAIFALMVKFYYNSRRGLQDYYTGIIAAKDDTINIHAEFAKEIGKGNYDVHIDPDSEKDVLGISLLVMKENLLANHKKESEQNWISEGKNLVSNILRLYNNLEQLGDHVLEHLVKYIDAIQGAIYLYNEETDSLVSLSTYAYKRKKYLTREYKSGYGLIGQCAYEKDFIYRTEIPEDYYSISSGLLGDKKPGSLLLVPLISDENLQGVMEIASLNESISDQTISLVKELGEIIARTVFNLRINQRTEKLLIESQHMTHELQKNQDKLRENAEEMKVTQEELQESNKKLESNIQEVENAQQRLHWLLENASEIISIYDSDLKVTYVSPNVTRILGYTPEEMTKGKDFERLSLQGQATVREFFVQIQAAPSLSPIIEYSFVRKDGQMVSLETRGRNLLDDPSVNGIILNSNDITERRRAEKEERMRTKMQSLSENSLDIIIRLSIEGQFFYANPVLEDYMDINPAHMINKNISELLLPRVLKEYFESTIRQMKSEPIKTNTEISIELKMGDKRVERIISIDAIPEFSENQIETILVVGHDVTEAKRIEKEIQIKNRKIEDSINYAERIQSSILPGIKQISEHFPNSFIYYKPRDVISGDIPWFFPKNELLYISAIDCTGHGVPGALISFLGYFLLNNIVEHETDLSAADICDRLHLEVRRTLKQETEEADARDGMDIAFCKINTAIKQIQYSGAHRPLYFLRKGVFTEYKGNRKAIGGIPPRKKIELPFTNYRIDYQSGDKIFFFTDGLPDQLGGEENKKYSTRRIQEIIETHPDFTMDQYKNNFQKDFEDWMTNSKQIDDILLVGIEF